MPPVPFAGQLTLLSNAVLSNAVSAVAVAQEEPPLVRLLGVLLNAAGGVGKGDAVIVVYLTSERFAIAMRLGCVPNGPRAALYDARWPGCSTLMIGATSLYAGKIESGHGPRFLITMSCCGVRPPLALIMPGPLGGSVTPTDAPTDNVLTST
jgi:hypothetical protein